MKSAMQPRVTHFGGVPFPEAMPDRDRRRVLKTASKVAAEGERRWMAEGERRWMAQSGQQPCCSCSLLTESHCGACLRDSRPTDGPPVMELHMCHKEHMVVVQGVMVCPCHPYHPQHLGRR